MAVCSHDDGDPPTAAGARSMVIWRLGLEGAVRAMNRPAVATGGEVGGAWRDRWPAETRAAIDQALETARHGETAAFHAQARWGARERVRVEVVVSPLLGGDGTIEGLSASAREVTLELETAAVLADISHEVRTPLHGIVAGMEILVAQPLAQAHREVAIMVRCSALALEASLQQILAMIRPAEGGVLRRPEPADETFAAAPWSAVRDGRPQILVADDHPTNCRVVELILGDFACVRAVGDGREAIEAFAQQPFDLVLMDIQMPVLDGLSAVGEIRRWEALHDRPRTPIAMLTANTDPDHVAAGRAAGADQHIAKPFTPNLLVSCVQALLHVPAGVSAA